MEAGCSLGHVFRDRNTYLQRYHCRYEFPTDPRLVQRISTIFQIMFVDLHLGVAQEKLIELLLGDF